MIEENDQGEEIDEKEEVVEEVAEATPEPAPDPCAAYGHPYDRVVIAEENFEGNILASIRTGGLKLIKANDVDKLHLSYYKIENIGEDEVWDVWQIEGPKMVWYFRGKPHVHVWANIEA